MAEECTHECSSCGESGCSDRTAQGPSTIETNSRSNVKHVIGVVSGKGGVGKSLVTSLLASERVRRHEHPRSASTSMSSSSTHAVRRRHGRQARPGCRSSAPASNRRGAACTPRARGASRRRAPATEAVLLRVRRQIGHRARGFDVYSAWMLQSTTMRPSPAPWTSRMRRSVPLHRQVVNPSPLKAKKRVGQVHLDAGVERGAGALLHVIVHVRGSRSRTAPSRRRIRRAPVADLQA